MDLRVYQFVVMDSHADVTIHDHRGKFPATRWRSYNLMDVETADRFLTHLMSHKATVEYISLMEPIVIELYYTGGK